MARRPKSPEGPDLDQVTRQVEAVLAEPLYWFPVRHHSPAVARFLEEAFRQRRPKVVFIEAPHEANDLIPYLVDPKTKPPIAIYSSYRDDNNVLGLAGIASAAPDIPPRFASWDPLLPYSPEYVALRLAAELGAQAIFIDLPHYAQIKPEEMSQPATDPGTLPRDRLLERQTERHIVESSFFQQLAAAGGYRSWNEAWDTLFEIRPFADAEAFRQALAFFCAAARATSPPVGLIADGTLERERHMLHVIRASLQRLKLKPHQAMVVCGGFHLFLDRDDPTPPPTPPPGSVFTSVVPYSYFRFSELSGYGAGNRAPRFYQLGWDLEQEGRADDLATEHIVTVLKEARKEGETFSAADAISARHHAEMLARLRGRAVPILDDLEAALVACCCKGDLDQEGQRLRRALDAAAIGTKIGRVTPALGRLPLVNDFYGLLDDLDLAAVTGKEKRLTVELDKRDERDVRRSACRQRLAFLEVGLGQVIEAPRGDLATGKLFREKWVLKWSPKIEAELVERNLYGDSVEAAALARLREELARGEMHAGKTCGRLVQAIDMDLPAMVQDAEEACGQAIDEDARFDSLCTAFTHLQTLDRYAAYRHLRRERLDDLILRCYDRACFAIADVVAVPEEQQPEVIAGLQVLAETVLRDDRPGLERVLFATQVRKAAATCQVPYLRGAFLGILSEVREISAADLAAEVSALAQAAPDRQATAGDFLHGVLAVSRTSVMLGADALIAAVDELLRAAPWDAFLLMLPRLRAAFEQLHQRQRDALAERVAVRYGLAEGSTVAELHMSVATATALAQVDRRVAEIMQKWGF